jgi:hypothetical protein
MKGSQKLHAARQNFSGRNYFMRYNLLIPRPYQFGPSLANASF